MEFLEYPLLHEQDLMLTLLRLAADQPTGIEDAVARLKRNLASIGENPPVSQDDIRRHLRQAGEYLTAARLLEQAQGRFEITDRGRETLARHPRGIDQTVLMRFPEFRQHIADKGEPDSGNSRSGDYLQGVVAFQSGSALTDNTFPSDTVAHMGWQDGWLQARQRSQELDRTGDT